MSLRVKVVGAMLIVALMVPVLGGVAITRVSSINNDVSRLSTEIPNFITVKQLEQTQHDQQAAVLAYVANGSAQELTRFQDLSQSWDQQFNQLKQSGTQDDDRLQKIQDQRTKFLDVAGQLLGSRATLDRALNELRTRDNETSQEINAIRQRYVSTATNNQAIDPVSIPSALRVQINDLLLGTEGMLQIVADQFADATGYVIGPNDAAKQRFTTATPIFGNWFQIANAAAGPDDKTILARVQNRYTNQFEPAGRQIIQATDFSNGARASFTEASTNITGLLNEIVGGQLSTVTNAQSNAKSIANGATGLMLFVTVLGFLLAGLAGFVLANGIVNPIVHLRDVADRVSRGDVEGVEIDVQSKDEIGDLAGAFRRMVASIKFLMAGDLDEEVIEPPFVASPAGD